MSQQIGSGCRPNGRPGTHAHRRLAAATRHTPRARFTELLESRHLLAAIAWDGGGDGTSWHDAANWAGDVLPGPTDDVTISLASSPTVRLTNGTRTIQSLVSDETLIVSGGALVVVGQAQLGAALTLAGGTLIGGTWNGAGGIMTASSTASTIEGLTLNTALTVENAARLWVRGGLTLNSTLTVNSTQSWTIVEFVGTQALTGAGDMLLRSTSPYNRVQINGQGAGGTLTIGPDITIHGRGAIEGLQTNDSILNQGLISADVLGQSLGIGGAMKRWTNAGTLQVKAGATLVIDSLDNTDAVQELDAAEDATIELGGRGIRGGTVRTLGDKRINLAGGTLDGVTLDLDATVPRGSNLVILNGLAIDGQLTLNSTTAGGSNIYFRGTQTLSGSGRLQIGATAPQNLWIDGQGWGSTLTIAPGLTISGQGNILSSQNSDRLINHATINADVPGAALRIALPEWTNTGLLKAAPDATLVLDGLNNAGRTLTLQMPGGLLEARGRGITGGRIVETADADITMVSGLLAGVTLDAGVRILNGSTLTIRDGLTLNRKLLVGGTGAWTTLRFEGTQTLGGAGTVELGETAANNRVLVDGQAYGALLTVGPDMTIQGRGAVYNNYPNDSLRNQGTISANISSQTLNVSFPVWTSTGLLRAVNAGILQIDGLDGAGAAVSFDAGDGIVRFDSRGLKNATLRDIHDATLTLHAAAFDAVTLDADIIVPNNVNPTIRNGLTVNGALTLAGQQSWTRLQFFGTQSLQGSGEVIFGDAGPYNGIWLNGETYGATLTIGPDLTLRGRGSITAAHATDRLLNRATVVADVSGQPLIISATRWTNAGTLRARNGGKMQLDGTFNQLPGSVFDSAGGTFTITGTLDNTGATLDLNIGADPLTLTGTILGGTVTNSGGGGLLTTSGTLDAVTIDSNLTVPNGANLVVRNGLTLNGSLTLGSSGAWAQVFFDGTQSLLGTGLVILGDTGQYNRIYIRGDNGANPATLTIGPDITVRAVKNGWLTNFYGNDSLINQGTIIADGNAVTFTVSGLNWVNHGLLQAVNGGALLLAGSFSQGPDAAFDSTAGSITIAGTLENTGNTLELSDQTGSVNLTGAIHGGTLAATGAATVVMASGAVLDALTLDADLTVRNATNITVRNGLTLNGTLTVASTGAWTDLYFKGTQSLLGAGHIVLGQTAPNNRIFVSGDNNASPAVLTIGPGITIRSAQGGSLTGQFAADTLVNQGTIQSDATAKTLTVAGANWANTGLLKAANGGILNLAGVFTQAGLGTFDSAGGTVTITGTLDNSASTLNLSDLTGSLGLSGTIRGGTIAGGGAAELVVANGTLDGVTLSATTRVSNNSRLYVRNGMTLNGNLILGSTGNWTDLYFMHSQTLLGTGTIQLGDSSPNARVFVNGEGYGAALTIGAGITLRGGGSITSSFASDSLDNAGTISADMAGASLTVSFVRWTNTGLMRAANGATINLDGLDNAGRTLELDAAGGRAQFAGRGVSGGAIVSRGNTPLTLLGSTLTGVTFDADATLLNGQALSIRNDLTLNGRLSLASSNSWTDLAFFGTQRLLGAGQVILGADGPYNRLYVNGQGYGATLTIGPGITVRGRGTVAGTNVSDHVVNQGTIRADVAGQTLAVSMASWSSDGPLQATNGASLAIDGLDNTGHNLTLQAAGSFVRFDNRGVRGGAIDIAAPGTTLTGGTLDAVTLNGSATLASGALLVVQNGLTLNGTLTLDSRNAYTYLRFLGTQTFGGAGQVLLGGATPQYNRIDANGGGFGSLLTVGPGISIRGGGRFAGAYATDLLVNQGTIRIDDLAFRAITNTGLIDMILGAALNVSDTLTINAAGALASQASSSIVVSGHLLGDAVNAAQSSMLGAILMNGAADASNPRLLEAFSKDRGALPDAMNGNFALGSLSLAGNTYVKLVDQADNAAGPGAEAVYVGTLIVPNNATLDLNGLNLYARLVQVNGTVLGGAVAYIPDGGPISIATPTPGSINPAGQLDEWTFFGHAGRYITAVVNPGGGGASPPITPHLNHARVEILDALGNSLGSGSSDKAGEIVALRDVLLPGDGPYRIQVRAKDSQPNAAGNYTVTLWDVTPVVSSLVMNQQVSGRIATPYSVDRWTFSATAAQQIRFDLISVGGPGLVFDLDGPDGWKGFDDATGDSDLITLPAAGAYTLSVQGTGGQYGAAYSFRIQETAQTQLEVGSVYNGTLAGSGHAQLFKIDVPQSTPLRIRLDDVSTQDHNELYVRLGIPPTRASYDYRSSAPASPDQEITVPMASGGAWYLLLYGDYVPTPGNYSLLASTSGMILDSVTPDHHGNGANAVLTLAGAGFDSTTQVELIGADSTHYPASDIAVDSFTQLTATFDAGWVPPGLYTLRVSNPGGDSAELVDGFQMTAGGDANLVTNLIIPGSVGRHATATIYVEYANTGQVAMPAPLLILHGTQRSLMTLSQELVVQGFWTSSQPQGFTDTIQILASGQTPGVLQPGESFQVPVYYAGLLQPWDFGQSQVEFSLATLTADSTDPVQWNDLKDDMRPAGIGAPAWDAVWLNFASQVGNTWGGFVSMLDENAAYLGRLGQRIVDVNELLSFEFQQANALSVIRTLSSAVDVEIAAPGLPIVFARQMPAQIEQRYELGTLGRGWSHNWQWALSLAADGTVIIDGPGGSRRTFQPDSRGEGYFPRPGDFGVLTALGGGAYALREPDGIQYVFRPDGKLDRVQDPNGNRISAQYTGNLLTGLLHSSGQRLQIAYNAAGRIIRLTDPQNRQTNFTYDPSGEHLLGVQGPDGQTTTYSYSLGQGATREHALTQIAHPGGMHDYYQYDAAGRLVSSSRDGNAQTVSYSYDAAGTVTATDAAGRTARFYIDHRGLVVKTEDGLGNAHHLAFDEAFQLTGITDPAGRSYRYTYDAAGNLVTTVNPLGHVSRFAYTGPYNRLASLTDANGNLTRFSLDANGNLQSITYADGARESWTYDSYGNPTSWTSRRGNIVQFTYDSSGRTTRKSYPDGSHTDYVYDARGNLLSVTDATGTTAFQYDPNDRPVRIDYPAGQSLAFTYDAAGRRTSSTDQLGHKVNYTYDPAGRLRELTDASGARLALYTYDAAGYLLRKDLGNGVYTSYAYDAAGRVIELTNRAPDNALLTRYLYAYDTRGRRISATTLDGTWTYSYDDIGQLTRAVLDSTNPQVPDQDLQFSYDAMGNRTRTVINGATTDYVSNNMNQYVRVGLTDYAFDADGNLIQETGPAGAINYTYDFENRLVSVASTGHSSQYAYNAFGHRVRTTTDGLVRNYVVDPIGLGNIVAEYDAAGSLLSHYDFDFGLISAQDAAGSRTFFTYDVVGNILDVTNAAGQLQQAYRYLPFGQLIGPSAPSAAPFNFAGGLGAWNDGALLYMRERFYSPNLGRFISEDPVGLAGRDLNLHRYVLNNPLSWADPSGLGYFGKRPLKGLPFMVNSSIDDYFNTEISHEHYFFDDGDNIGFGPDGRFNDKDTSNYEKTSGHYDDDIMREALQRMKDKPYNVNPFPSDTENCQEWAERLRQEYDKVARERQNNQTGVAGAVDPNEKTGPAGYGPASFIRATGALAYRIDFENDKQASAPAQQVFITDQLDSNFDWSSLLLTEVAFGDVVIAIPKNSQYFETAVPTTYNGVTFETHIQVGIQLATGKLYANFRSLDPATGLPPDVLIGFLPPEDGTGRGMGHVSYTIKPRTGLPTGTEIRNIALISFDYITPIATNQIDPHDASKGTDPNKEALITIDAGAPASNVNALPATVASTSFQVAWSGQDDAGGSGIARYDIYVSDNGGAFALWLDDTTATSATFHGANAHSYAFYSVAVDHVGNIETAPATADAQTTVQAGGPLQGTSGDDTFYIRVGAPGILEIYPAATPTGTPVYTAALASLSSLALPTLAGNDRIIVDFTNGSPVPSGGLNLDAGDGADHLVLIPGPAGDALTVGPTSITLAQSTIARQQIETVSLDGDAIALAALTLNGAARLDLADNSLVLRSTPAQRNAVRQQLTGYFQAGQLYSSSASAYTTLAISPNDNGTGQPFASQFSGIPVTVNDILVKFTYKGDANLDGVVNADDYFQIDQGYISQKASWYNGNFNYDQAINADDYFLIDQSLVGQGAPLAAARRQSAYVELFSNQEVPGELP